MLGDLDMVGLWVFTTLRPGPGLRKEAAQKLTESQAKQTEATREKTVDEILAGMQTEPSLPPVEEGQPMPSGAPERKACRRRQKMRSTPVVGGGLFGETDTEEEKEAKQEQRKPVVFGQPGSWR